MAGNIKASVAIAARCAPGSAAYCCVPVRAARRAVLHPPGQTRCAPAASSTRPAGCNGAVPATWRSARIPARPRPPPRGGAPSSSSGSCRTGTAPRPSTADPESPHDPPVFRTAAPAFIDQIDGPTAAYNIPLAMRLRGSVVSEALRDALTDVVRHHESLRTVFAEVSGSVPADPGRRDRPRPPSRRGVGRGGGP